MKLSILAKLKKSINHHRYRWILGSYIIICVAIVVADFYSINGMISNYNSEQATMVTKLLVNNVNSKLNDLIEQVEQVSSVVLLSDSSNKDKLNNLVQYQKGGMVGSIGYFNDFMDFSSDVAARNDLAKHNYIHQAVENADTYITDPYRSSITGQYVITVFVPVYDGDTRVGTVHADIDLDKIASFADTEGLGFNVKVCILNSKSLNYIACNDSVDLLTGNWYSLLLTKEEMSFKEPNEYTNFLKEINSEVDNGILRYSRNGKEYTLGYANINKMINWYLALSIENDELSDTFTLFSNMLSKYMFVLFGITLIYAIGIVIMELIQRRNFQKLCNEDAMTGLYNKRTFTYLVKEYMESGNALDAGTLVFVDVDDFKKYNDNYGHLNGDIVLKSFAKALSDQFSKEGYVGRYGGDEFVVFVKEAHDKEQISKQFMKVREVLSSIELEGFGNVPASFSAGAANYPSDAIEYEELCNAADNALYKVKESGKGKLYWYK